MNLSKLLTDFIGYGGSLLVKRLMLLSAVAIIAARILGPQNYGLWVMFSLMLRYGNYIHFGIGSALIREVPFYLGKNDFKKADETKNVAFTSIVFFSSVVGIIIFSCSFLFMYKYGMRLVISLWLIALVLILQQVYEFFRRYFIANNNFKVASEMIIFLTVLLSFFTIVLIMKFNFVGIPLALICSYGLCLAYIFKYYKIDLQPQIDTKITVHLIKIGFPIVASVAAYEVFITAERLLVLRYFGSTNLGYYSLTCGISDFLILFSVAFADIVYVNLSKQYGATDSVKGLKSLVYETTILLAYFLSIFLYAIYIFLPIIVKIGLPQYIQGVAYARQSLPGIFFLCICTISGQFLITINKQVYYFLAVLLALIIKITVCYFFIIWQTGILGIVLGTILVYFLFSNIVLLYVFWQFKESIKKGIIYISRIYAPIIYVFLIIFIVVKYVMHNPMVSSWGELSRILTEFFILLTFILFPLGYIIKNFIYNKTCNN